MSKKLNRTLFLAVLAASFGPAHALITPISGDYLAVPNPADQKYIQNAYNDPDPAPVRYWTERTNYTLSSDLVISRFAPVVFPTTINSHPNNNDSKILAGTAIRVHYFYFDPASDSVVARFKFDDPILAIITNERGNATNDHFMLSDYLINPLVPVANKPASHFGERGLEISGDHVIFHAANEISVDWTASSPGDQMRIITAVPEPGSVIAVGLGVAALLVRRRAH